MLADIDMGVAYVIIAELCRECAILDERSDRDGKYVEEICKERQLLIAQKTVLENRLGEFESFSELERKFKELEWQLEVEKQHRRDEEKDRQRLHEMAQRANSDFILARSFTIALELEWQVAKKDYLERLEVLGRERHHAMLAEIASQKELRKMRGMTGSDQTVDDRIRLSNEEIDRLRAKLQKETTACHVQLADKDKKIHDLELSLKTARLDYAELEENLGLIGYSDEGVEGAVREEGRAGNMNEDEVEGGDGDKSGGNNGNSGEDHDGEKKEDEQGKEVEYEELEDYSEDKGEGKGEEKGEEGGGSPGKEVAKGITEEDIEMARKRLDVLFGRASWGR